MDIAIHFCDVGVGYLADGRSLGKQKGCEFVCRRYICRGALSALYGWR